MNAIAIKQASAYVRWMETFVLQFSEVSRSISSKQIQLNTQFKHSQFFIYTRLRNALHSNSEINVLYKIARKERTKPTNVQMSIDKLFSVLAETGFS